MATTPPSRKRVTRYPSMSRRDSDNLVAEVEEARERPTADESTPTAAEVTADTHGSIADTNVQDQLETLESQKADTTALGNVPSLASGGADGDIWKYNSEGELVTVEGSGYLNPSQVSSGEKTAGTETAIRMWSPEDVKEMVTTHETGGGGGGAGDLEPEDVLDTADTYTLGTGDFGKAYTYLSDDPVTIAVQANVIIPAVTAARRIGINKGGAGTVTVTWDTDTVGSATYFTRGEDLGNTPSSASFVVTGQAYLEIRQGDGNTTNWWVEGETDLNKSISGDATFNDAVNVTGALDVDGATTVDALTAAEATNLDGAVTLSDDFTMDGSSKTADFGGSTVTGNKAKVVTSVSGTLTRASHEGNVLVTSGNITVPTDETVTNATVIAGGAHTISFNSTTTAAATSGQMCSFVVQSSTVIKITPWTDPQTLT